MFFKKCLIAIFLSSLPFTVYAQISDNSLTNELYVKSGMEKQVQQIPLLIKVGFDQALTQDEYLRKIPRNIRLDIKGLIKESFAAERLKKTITEEIEADISHADIKEVIKWLDSPLGKKCTQLEEAASTAEALTEIQRFAAQLQESPPSSDRMKLVQRLDSTVRVTETNVTLSLNIQLAIAAATVAALPLETQIPLSEIMEQLEKSRPQLEAAIKSQVLMTALYTYRSLSNFELEKYIEFAGSEVGVKYHRVTIAGFKKAMIDGSIRLGNSIGELLQDTNKQSET